MHQDPGDMALYNSLIMLPWSLKILYGLITDNVPVFGLKRKPYLIFFGVLQFIFMFLAFSYTGDSPMSLVFFLFISSLSTAFSNVVVDAIMVV
jgi:MFS-type transporter involved in bile tolerance (Atg22 family)